MAEIIRQRHKIDATGQSIGRLACRIAILLRGKNKSSFTPNFDHGDFVEIFNLKLAKFTGKKMVQKKYYRHSGYPGGLKTKNINEIWSNNPSFILQNAVKEMLPGVKFRPQMLKRLSIKL